MKHLLLIVFLFTSLFTLAQNEQDKRVLFVFDASGSMNAKWEEDSKLAIAQQTLIDLIDSIQQNNPNVEIGLRVFGHQSHKNENNCKDTKLEVGFNSNQQNNLINIINSIEAKGHTPIAYSLTESAKDFPDNDKINAIILITDGLENCDGDPCEAAKYLNEKKISINPFIIGLDIADSLQLKFDCIGQFVNAKDKQELKQVLQETVSLAVGETTLSISLQLNNGQLITNTPFSLIDPYQSNSINTYIHTLTKAGIQDTLRLDPRGFFQVVIHSFPEIKSDIFQLESGKHNEINMTIPKSALDVDFKPQYDDPAYRFYIQKNNQWIYNHIMNDITLLSDDYQITNTLLPFNSRIVKLEEAAVTPYKTFANGRLNIHNNKQWMASIYQIKDNNWQLAVNIGELNNDYQIKLQPGDYALVYIHKEEKNSEQTHQHRFTIYENKTTVIDL